MIVPSASAKLGPPLGEIVAHTTIRGIAALCVAVYHVSLSFRAAAPELGQGFAAHSYLFVDLFFALSGYILGRKYQTTFAQGVMAKPARQFLAQRFARLYPNYLFWFMCALCVSLMIGFWREHEITLPPGAGLSILMHVTATQGILGASVRWNIPLWSIGVEFVLYMLFPWIARFLTFGGKSGAAILTICALGALSVLSSTGTIDVITGALSILRGVASFSVGMILARYLSQPLPLSDKVLSSLQIAACLLVALCVHQGAEIGSILAFYGLAYVSQFNRGILYRVAGINLLHRIGELSYSIYLAHSVVMSVLILVWYKLNGVLNLGPMAGFVTVGCSTIVISVMVAEISYRFLELPAQTWLKHRLL